MRQAAVIAALVLALGGSPAGADDPDLSIEQVPPGSVEKPDGVGKRMVPERCRKPEIAESDPSCEDSGGETVNGALTDEDEGGVPLIEDQAEDRPERLIPGVTINQGGPPSRIP